MATAQTTAQLSADTRRIARAGRRPLTWAQVGQFLVLLFVLGIILFPLYWMVTTSFKQTVDTFAVPPVLIFQPTTMHYESLFAESLVPKAALNSLLVASGATLLSVLLGTPAAYVMARFEFRGKRDLWFWYISNRFITPVVVVLPFFLIARQLNLLDSQWYLVLVYQTFTIPLVVWLCLDQFRAVPRDVDDAAKVDGCNLFQTFFYINLPLAIPGIVVSAILSFIFSWNEMLFALLLTQDQARTAPVEASSFMTGMGIRWGEMMATGTLIVLPVVIFAALVSRHLVRGLTMGAVK